MRPEWNDDWPFSDDDVADREPPPRTEHELAEDAKLAALWQEKDVLVGFVAGDLSAEEAAALLGVDLASLGDRVSLARQGAVNRREIHRRAKTSKPSEPGAQPL